MDVWDVVVEMSLCHSDDNIMSSGNIIMHTRIMDIEQCTNSTFFSGWPLIFQNDIYKILSLITDIKKIFL